MSTLPHSAVDVLQSQTSSFLTLWPFLWPSVSTGHLCCNQTRVDHLQSWPVNLCTLPTLFQSGFAVTLEQTLRTQPFCILKFEIQTHLQANSFYLWKLLFQSDILSDVTCQPFAQLKGFSTPFLSFHIPAIETNLLFGVFSHPLQSIHTWFDNLEYMCWLSKPFQLQNFFLLPQMFHLD